MPDEIDVAKVRADTPGCHEVIHFNNAGAALMPRPVLDATVGHLQLEALIGGYEAADQAETRIEATYGAIGRLIGAVIEQVAVCIDGDSAREGGKVGGDAIDRGVGEPGQWHCAGVDRIADRTPFVRHRFSERHAR